MPRISDFYGIVMRCIGTTHADLRDCPDGYVGYAIDVYDRGLWWGCYRLP
jgi:hypothetical protein